MLDAGLKLTRYVLVTVVVLAVVFIGARIYLSQRGPALEPWHTFVPRELGIAELDKASWADYLAAEERIFGEVDRNVVQKVPENQRVATNRYFSGSMVYPPSLSRDWNRSFDMMPEGEVAGAVVLLHGLTDSPYSLRHVADLYRKAGFAVIGLRLPGHGTVPAALTGMDWETWMAATRLAAREASRRAGADKPLHVVGYSNGGALALKYAADTLDDAALPKPGQVILVSPMIGVTQFARFAGFAALPAVLPRFAKAAWLGLVPEFNPFKYNSFPVNGAVQSHRLTSALQSQIADLSRRGKLADLAPTLTFQSILDSTVSTEAILSAFYALLPKNGSELVLFDVNHSKRLGPLLRHTSYSAMTRLLPPARRNFRTAVITNEQAGSENMVERAFAPGSSEEQVHPLGLTYPPDVYSLSHIALPFPPSDGLYGTHPDPAENYGLQLGAIAVRGERGGLIISADGLTRMSSNPFFDYMAERIGGVVAGR